ncbi:MAG TPA: hypothetical protein VEN31_00685 [Candidatus Bathyarchaeia archaeon]|nr:hypothetical protein [Candidatus Bathyarchaeia archaeon]
MIARRGLVFVLAALLAASCGLQSLIPRPPPTEAPFCAPLDDVLGSIQLDYAVVFPTQLATSAADAERVGRSMMGDQGTTCSVRLAKYDNLADHRPLVWVVHLDGLAIEGIGGSMTWSGTQPPPHYIRRALAIVSTDAPPTPLFSIATGR